MSDATTTPAEETKPKGSVSFTLEDEMNSVHLNGGLIVLTKGKTFETADAGEIAILDGAYGVKRGKAAKS